MAARSMGSSKDSSADTAGESLFAHTPFGCILAICLCFFRIPVFHRLAHVPVSYIPSVLLPVSARQVDPMRTH